MEVRVRAFQSRCTPAASGLDCLSSAGIRTERDVVQSSEMIHARDQAAADWCLRHRRLDEMLSEKLARTVSLSTWPVRI